jgi:hypothetical protein
VPAARAYRCAPEERRAVTGLIDMGSVRGIATRLAELEPDGR